MMQLIGFLTSWFLPLKTKLKKWGRRGMALMRYLKRPKLWNGVRGGWYF